MLRRAPSSFVGASASAAATSLELQRRGVRYSGIADTLGSSHHVGKNAGQVSSMSEINTFDAEQEIRRPQWRSEVMPKKKEWTYLRTMYKWGFNSLSLFYRVNEHPGPWWNANSGIFTSTWSQIGDHGAAGMWSGVWAYTFGISCFNLRPGDLFSRTFGRRDKAGAVHINYEESSEMAKTKPQLLMLPHTKEHQAHQRIKNPPLDGFKDIEALHAKRVLRECQYHLGNSLRYYLVDGVFGNHTETGTPYRIFTDNPDHAYIASISALRKFNYVAPDEVPLTKRVAQNPMDEWSWRRPGVIMYHCPSFDFEAPRIVEEFGGPRPADLSLKHQKFTVLDPYSIPMKGISGGVTSAEEMLQTVGFLCARWGYYADGKQFLTLRGDSVLSADGNSLTVVVTPDAVNSLRSSPNLYSTRHIRIGDGVVSRCWDSNSLPATGAKLQDRDLVEESFGLVHRPLPLHVGADPSVASKMLSHRLFGRRRVTQNKQPHRYTDDPAQAAALGGHLFKAPKSKVAMGTPRPAAMRLEATNFVIAGAAAGKLASDVAAKSIVESLSKNGWLYAEPEKLQESLAAVLAKAKSVTGGATDEISSIVAKLQQ